MHIGSMRIWEAGVGLLLGRGIENSVIGPRGFARDDDVWAGPEAAVKGRMHQAHYTH